AATTIGAMPPPTPYWSLRETVDTATRAPVHGSLDDILDQLDDVLGSAVRMRLHADVPLGALLSGGIDSSLIVAMMQRHGAVNTRTFTISFEDAAYDEGADARRVAEHLGTEHVELSLGAGEALKTIPALPEIYDEPFADSSQVPTVVLARLTREHVTVALAGDGGDELFGGYNRYAWAEHYWRRARPVPRPLRRAAASALRAIPPRSWDRLFHDARMVVPRSLRVRTPGMKIHKAADVLAARDLRDAYMTLVSHFPDPTRLVLGSAEPPTSLTAPESWPALAHPVASLMYLDALTYLPDDILTKVDRATMAASLEARLPFLDHRVAAFAWRLPLELKVHEGTGKWLLRRLLDRYVPAPLVDRPKAGFGIPLDTWLRGPLREWTDALLDEGRLRHEGYLDAALVRQMWRDHLAGRHDHQYRLWDVLMFEAWLTAGR
ncbi:MAG TPA: asparagine synthase C-terminal domain-containing protein, partial [Acidimicrobiales bacterium]|nr:asparagine synthase C-terminal domain-containing protein [Acidimicrobiales bacterium]